MKLNEFKVWIEGYLSLSSEKVLTASQVRIIQNHANLVTVINKKNYLEISEILEIININSNSLGELPREFLENWKERGPTASDSHPTSLK